MPSVVEPKVNLLESASILLNKEDESVDANSMSPMTALL